MVQITEKVTTWAENSRPPKAHTDCSHRAEKKILKFKLILLRRQFLNNILQHETDYT